MTERSPRSIALQTGRYLLAAAALWWAVDQVEVAAVVAGLARLSATAVVAVVVVTVVGLVARFDTWRAVLAPVASVSLRTAAAVDLAVNFVNQVLPSRLSGRIAAPFVIKGETQVGYADAAAVAVVHTGLYALLYGVVSTVGLGLLAARLPAGLVVVLGLSTALYLAAGVVVLVAGANLRLLDPLVSGLAALVGRLPRVGTAAAARVRGLTAVTEGSTERSRSVLGSPAVWVRYAAGWSVLHLVVPGVRVALLLAAFGVTVTPAWALPLYLVTAYSVTLLPLTPGGIGVTEATATAVFVGIGVPESAILTVVFLDRALGVYLPALAGWYPALGLDRSASSG